uniref:UTP3 small subunit processome component n=1 Tax=Monodelphis domestica TaxID=13616 RepID=F7FNE1_MONDO
MVGKTRKRTVGQRRPAKTQVEEEEEEQELPPSPGDPSYFQDQVDAFHEARSRAALAPSWSDGESGAEDPEEEEEVLGLDLHEDSEEEEDGEEDEEDEEEDDAASVGGSSVLSDADPAADADPSLSWGQRKNLYYNTDYRASKGKGLQSQQEADEEEREEEEEAQLIQRRLAQGLQEDDFGLSWVEAFGKSALAPALPEEAQTRVVKDLDKMPSKEKLKMLRKESPELLELIEDLKAKIIEVKDELEPLLHMVEKGIIPPGKGSQYLKTKYNLYLNYCSNISFYLVLKARRVPIHGHPVIERLVTYRNLINKLAIVDQRLSNEMRRLLTQSSTDGKVAANLKKKATKLKPKSLTKIPDLSAVPDLADDSDLDEEASLKHYKEMEERLKLKRKKEEAAVGEEEVLEDPNAKRAITYQIAKNKGLTPRRKKIDRNPRVKHREKFRRAKIRRRGQVPQVRTEEYKYSGELSGIRAGVKKSIKLK